MWIGKAAIILNAIALTALEMLEKCASRGECVCESVPDIYVIQ